MTHSKIIVFIILIALLLVGCSGSGATAIPTATEILPTVTRFPPTETFVPVTVGTSTVMSSLTPTSVSNSIFYMFVVDASEKMTEPFDGKTKMDAAREAIESIMAGLDAGANYGLVVIGGSAPSDGTDPCNQPSVTRTPFSARDVVSNQVSLLHPAGGGSMYSAFVLARRQFEALPSDTVRALVMLTDTSDECPGQDEWKAMENLSKVLEAAGLEFHSEIIVLDQAENLGLQSVSDRISIWSKERIIVHFPHNFAMLQETIETVLASLASYVEPFLGARATATPPRSAYTVTSDPDMLTSTLGASSFTLTPVPGLQTNTPGASSFTLTPRPGTATFTPTVTFTPIPRTETSTLTPTVTRTPTPTQAPTVELLSVRFRTTGIGCQVDIVVTVSGSPATGSFHVMNTSNAPTGQVFQQVILPLGTYSNNIVSLSGNRPETYVHEVWFEFNGVQSNRLKNLRCPFLPTATPTP